MNIEELFKESISYISSNTRIEKNNLISKFSNLNSLIQNYKSNLSQNTVTSESDHKGVSEGEEKAFNSPYLNKLLWNPSDYDKKTSGNIYSNLLSISLKKSSVNNHFM